MQDLHRPTADEHLGVPRSAAWLGGLGLLPFLAGTAGVWLLEQPRREAALLLLTGYAAVILAFMGAVHWGLAMAAPAQTRGRVMTLSVIPALLAWVALSLPPGGALALMAAGYLGVYLMDSRAVAIGLAPRWYRRLRIPLTAAVLTCVSLSLAAVVVKGTP
jgi:hypothetical protein